MIAIEMPCKLTKTSEHGKSLFEINRKDNYFSFTILMCSCICFLVNLWNPVYKMHISSVLIKMTIADVLFKFLTRDNFLPYAFFTSPLMFFEVEVF